MGSVPSPGDAHAARGYGNSGVADFATGNPSATTTSPLGQSFNQQSYPSGQFHENFDAGPRGSSIVDEPHSATTTGINRSASNASTAVAQQNALPSRNNTLRKKSSMRRVGSLKRSGSRKSLAAGSIKGVGGSSSVDGEHYNSAFYTPVPTQGSPTEVLANRFQAWRQLLKSLIAYFREIQNSYDARAKAVGKVQHVIANIQNPAIFLTEGGLGNATRILDDYHKHSVTEANKSREIENDVIGALSGLRSDLGQKIKEIKSLSGDFKNSVEKEKEGTRREVDKLQEALQHADHEDGSATGKNDPFVVRLGVDRAVEKQIDEENYLHRAYLNLESSGRELESIVVGEIQKAYNALAGILKREGDDAYSVVESLRNGPISLSKDQEWQSFVSHDPHFVSPDMPLRRIEEIQYPGKDHPAATEIRSGMLERKSKYLKSYTAGWYVLSPTHLHEFKSADKIYTQPPVMSLYLLDQKLGSHSETGSSSAKFMLKGKQAGGMHKGHSWVFRAESHDTMLAWFNDIKILTEKSGEERNAFVRSHARSVSGNGERPRSFSSDGLEEDEADAVPYSADAASLAEQNPIAPKTPRPLPGGRFPSDLNVNRNNRMSPSSNESDTDIAPVTVPAVLPVSHQPTDGSDPYRLRDVDSGSYRDISNDSTIPATTPAPYDEDQSRYMAPAAGAVPPQYVQPPPANLPQITPASQQQQAYPYPTESVPPAAQPSPGSDGRSGSYTDWLAPAAGGAAAGAGVGALGTEAYRHHQQDKALDDVNTREPVQSRPADVPPVSPVSPIRPTAEPTTIHGGPSPLPATAAVNPSSIGYPTFLSYAGDPSAPGDRAPMAPHLSDPMADAAAAAKANRSPTSPTVRADLSSGQLGGLESRGAHETGSFMPKVIRHDTDISVSGLHVPGEFPKRE